MFHIFVLIVSSFLTCFVTASPSQTVVREGKQDYKFQSSDFQDLERTKLYHELFGQEADGKSDETRYVCCATHPYLKRVPIADFHYFICHKRSFHPQPLFLQDTIRQSLPAVVRGHHIVVESICSFLPQNYSLGVKQVLLQSLFYTGVWPASYQVPEMALFRRSLQEYPWYSRKEQTEGLSPVFSIVLGGIPFDFIHAVNSSYIMTHSLTQEQYHRFMGWDVGTAFGAYPQELRWVEVNRVVELLNMLFAEYGLKGGFRLPRRDEWQDVAERNLPDDFEKNKRQYAHFGCRSIPGLGREGTLVPVDEKTPGRLGCCMCGNVWEWTSSQSNGLPVVCGGGRFSQEIGPHVTLEVRTVDQYWRDAHHGLRLMRDL